MSEDSSINPGRPKPTTTEHVAGKAHEAVDKASQRLSEQEVRVREGLSAREAQAKETYDQLKAEARAREAEFVQYVRDNPVKSVGIAFLAGYVLSALRR